MQSQNVDSLLTEATDLLYRAEDELSRPEEDVATFAVCQHSRQALMKSIIYFLLKNGIDPKEPATLESLLIQCKESDERFKDIDAGHIACTHEENSDDYCTSISHVSSCFDTARMVHNLIIK